MVKDLSISFPDFEIEKIQKVLEKYEWNSENAFNELLIERFQIEEAKEQEKKEKEILEKEILEKEDQEKLEQNQNNDVKELEIKQQNSEQNSLKLSFQQPRIIVPSFIGLSSPFEIQLSGFDFQNKWIGMYYSEETDSKKFIEHQTLKSSKLTFNSPNNVCRIEFRCFEDEKLILKSNQILIGPIAQIVAFLKDGKIQGEFIQLFGEPITNAWIGIFSSTEINPKNYITYQNIKDLNGTKFIFDIQLLSMSYNIRLFQNSLFNSYHEIGRSSDIIVNLKDDIEVISNKDEIIEVKVKVYSVDVYSSGSWIALYFQGEKDENYLEFKYVKKQLDEMKFKKTKERKYELRLFKDKGFQLLKKIENL